MDIEVVLPQIKKRVEDFRSVWRSKNEVVILKEAVFCLLTPQSKAVVCWEAVERLFENFGLEGVFNLFPVDIEIRLRGVRFRRNKAGYIAKFLERIEESGGVLRWLDRYFKSVGVELNDEFSLEDQFKLRNALAQEIKGYGLKEATHFLRNIGVAMDLAILDRHILKGMLEEGVIRQLPTSLSAKRYFEFEKKFIEWATKKKLRPVELDLFLWYKKTGFVFK